MASLSFALVGRTAGYIVVLLLVRFVYRLYTVRMKIRKYAKDTNTVSFATS